MARTYIGVSGWSYKRWEGEFYPEDVPRSRQLAYVGRRFNSVEVNGTFYSLQRPDTFRKWNAETPPSFRFAIKGSRYITHMRKLKDAETPLANFFAQGVLLLGEKLGPILWQLPGNLSFDRERTERFLALLPRNVEEASRLARRHDSRVEGRSWTQTGGARRIRHALEVREESWLCPELVRLLRHHGVALAFSHAGDWPYTEELTAGFVYLRLHGAPRTYADPYGPRQLDRWARRLRSWRAAREPADPDRITDRVPPRRKGRDLYVYFDNDAEGHAPFDALDLAERLGPDPDPVGEAERGTDRGD